MATVIMEM